MSRMRDRVRKKIHRRPELISNTWIWFSGSAPSPPWIDLPTDVTANILHRLGAIEILESAQFVCATWWRVCKDPAMWRVINYDPEFSLAPTLCHRAVDRSLGGLIEINIDFICTGSLLNYISDRSPCLKRLRITNSDFDVWGGGLASAIKKLPELEELHFLYTPSINAEDIENISRLCPMLKSFTYNNRCYTFLDVEIDDSYALMIANSYALVIAENMPNLRQLRLFGDRLSNLGLQAILDGCPHLELLDLRQCLMVDLQGDLGKRCSERIKDLRRPSDSTAVGRRGLLL